MDGPQVFESDHTLELIHRELVAHLGREVVAGSQRVASVDTHTHAALVLDTFYYTCYVFELPSEVGALSGGVLYHSGDAFGLVEGAVYLASNLVETLFLAYLVEVASRVEVHQLQAQLLSALHLVEEGVAAFLEGLFVGRAEIDEVAVVRQHIFRFESTLGE